MGFVLWLVSGCLALLVARIVPFARAPRLLAEGGVAIVTALLAGLTATWLDFGGVREPDWRAGLFSFLAALASLGITRSVRGGSRRAPASGAPPDRPRADS